ncbi:MAG: CocE/NonD family hydrolase [Saprospiraceae bacterium]|nr:CocE/NonD family hydrolase [Saprospiraceae bacterium]
MKTLLFKFPFVCWSILLLLFVYTNTFANNGNPKKAKKLKKLAQKGKISQLGLYNGYRQKQYKGYDYNSLYIPMKDSVRLALDVFTPKGLAKDKKVPTIVYFVRYVRSFEPRSFFKAFTKPLFGHVKKKEINFFTENGYACIIVDLRGSGASFGHRTMEFSPEEVADMSTVFDWIITQEWSDGGVATTGVSYTGTTAELALSSKHPALKACIPRFNIFDLYTDMCFPNGVRQAPFVDIWKKTTNALDNSDLKVMGSLAKMAIKRNSPVHSDPEGIELAKAVKEHEKNFDIFAGLYRVHNRNDVDTILNLPVDAYSVHNRLKEIQDSKVPMYRITGWYDGGNLISAFKGYWNTNNTEKVLVGPWDHGPYEQISPFQRKNKKDKAEFPVYLEMLRFLDHHMLGIQNGIDQEPPIYYYQMGSEEFRTSTQWPPVESALTSFYFSDQQSLTPTLKSRKEGQTTYTCDYSVGTGDQGRWNSLTPLYRGGPIMYKDRTEMNKKMVLFDTEPVNRITEITGYPHADIYLSADTEDTYLFVYLEDLAPNGEVTYITEGVFNAVHRKVSEEKAPYQDVGVYHSFKKEDRTPLVPGEVARLQFQMLPTSYQIFPGHSIRVSIAVADKDHFDLLENKPSQIKVYFSEEYPSKVDIPIIFSE